GAVRTAAPASAKSCEANARSAAPRVRFIEPVGPGAALEILALVRDGRADVTWTVGETVVARARFTLTEA
ncbi:MAG: hypothetical protein AAFX81_19455, partial [Pseudomonadota bacterium]